MGAGAQLDVTELAEIAGRHPSVRMVVLFGSVARGTPLPWSDLDVGVLGGTWLEQLKLGAALGRALGREAHVIELETAPDALRQEMARDGVLVREAVQGAWSDYRAQSFVRWFDLAPVRRRCAEGVRRRLRKEVGRG